MKAVFSGLWLSILFLVFQGALRGQSKEDCLACHGQPGMTVQRKGQEVQLYVDQDVLEHSAHESLSCVDCHQGFNPTKTPHAKVVKPVQCQTCHDAGAYDKSVHGMILGAEGCSECHGVHNILSPKNPESRTNRAHIVGTCGRCHKDEDDRYSRSTHGISLASGAKGAPSCADCHGSHTIVPIADPESLLYKTKEPGVCLKCHLDNPKVREQVGISAGFIADYKESIHGVTLAKGDLRAPSCSSCHGAHDMTLGSNQSSHVSKFKIPDTCGQCHGDIVKVYSESIHGTALKAGNQGAPNCTDCHGEHQIFAPIDPRSRVAGKNVSARVCAVCHNSVVLTQKYGLASQRFASFEDSYHGLASREGSVQVANCASCHGYHDVKASSDPASTINKANLPNTCGKCHQGANENFTKGAVHLVIAPATEPVLYWIKTFYIVMIVVVIGGMFVHNALDFIHKSKLRFALRGGLMAAEHFSPAQYLRMSLRERVQHAILAVSFITLVITGFMLKFPDAWWVTPIRQWSEWLFAWRGIVHRIAGVVLIGISIYHVHYVLFVSRGKQLIRDLMPKQQDGGEFWGMAKYYLGLSKSKPKFGRFAYVEKAEYWALIWGVIVMGGTGIILWFNSYFIGKFTLLGWNIAQAVHYYEAWLATLAILVWHFYFVIFNPSVYPLNTACITGTLTEEEMAEEHPREFEEILSARMEQGTAEEDAPSADHRSA
ncbi:MAG: cytochrome b/b6 domain-containing protein [Acidobacteriota bacterium]|jgi:cytochrome b subunit of formate dehydrogenase